MGPTGRRGISLPALAAALQLIVGVAGASEPEPLRVATSGDYAPFSELPRPKAALFDVRGLDPAIIRAYATERRIQIEWVQFRWPELVNDLRAGRFDIAIGGITVRPERSVAGRYSLPTASSGAVVLLPRASPERELAELDRRGVRIAVNAGGHLERVTRARFRFAEIIAVPDNAAVPNMLMEREVHAIVSDTLEAPHWNADARGWRVLGPFTHDRKAFLLAPERAALAKDLDTWLLRRERDATLAGLRTEYLGRASESRPAEPLQALVASVEERLALMPFVAAIKQRRGLPIEVPERETQVLDAAVAAVRSAAKSAGDDVAPSEAAVRRLFRAQIEAAKVVQRRVLVAPPPPTTPVFDLDTELRPALLRIGERIAWLLPRLPATLDPAEVRAASELALAASRLDPAHVSAIASAIAALRPAQ